MPCNKPIPNTNGKVADLLHEQNLYLENYEDFRIGGLHKAALEYTFKDESTIGSLMLGNDFIVDIHMAVFMEKKGIWTIETTKKEIANVIQWKEVNFFKLYTQVPEECCGLYTPFPVP
eukprot:1607210-Ditylum_brightwellii.AAC.1